MFFFAFGDCELVAGGAVCGEGFGGIEAERWVGMGGCVGVVYDAEGGEFGCSPAHGDQFDDEYEEDGEEGEGECIGLK